MQCFHLPPQFCQVGLLSDLPEFAAHAPRRGHTMHEQWMYNTSDNFAENIYMALSERLVLPGWGGFDAPEGNGAAGGWLGKDSEGGESWLAPLVWQMLPDRNMVLFEARYCHARHISTFDSYIVI